MTEPRARALTVGDIMTRPVLTARPDEIVAEAAARMHERRVGSIVVVEGTRPIGILTERDLVRFAAGAADARTALVRDHMTPDPDIVETSEEAVDAFRRLAAHGSRHIPVVAAGALVGIVSVRDLVMKLRRGPPVAAHGAFRPTAAVEALPPVEHDVQRTVLSLLDVGRATVPAVVVPDGPELTYRSLRRHVHQVADTLASLGIKQGDRVAIVLPNGAEAIVSILGAAVAATAAPINPAYTEDEFRFYFDDVGARALIVPPGQAETARRAWPPGRTVLEVAVEAGGKLRLDTAEPRATRRHPTDPRPDRVALVLHSSGTTGRPKRAALRHRNLVASVDNTIATYALAPSDVSVCVMPLFHIHGLVGCMLSTLAAGGTVIALPRFNPLGFARLLHVHRATWYTAVPTIHRLVLARGGERERSRGAGRLRFIRSASAKLPESTLLELERVFGVPVLEAYGMTEACHQIASNPLPPAPRVSGSVGRGVGVRIGVMDEEGNLLTVGASGEVVIQGPNVIDGYDQNPEADATSFTKGWFRTGDRGVLDASGYLTLVGRLKEMINRAGEKIAPHEIDRVLLMHPAVEDAIAFGVAHPVWGEVVEAMVVVRRDVTEADLVRHCREHLADFKIPARVHFTDAIPKTATGKVQRTRLAAMVKGPR
jgi:acyl-CoA synthetase (AMP-forming)/AMP-acid ligase II/CBS domain-containing protein